MDRLPVDMGGEGVLAVGNGCQHFEFGQYQSCTRDSSYMATKDRPRFPPLGDWSLTVTGGSMA